MNTNTIQVITSTVAIGFIAGFIGLEVTGNLMGGFAIGVSYYAVAALLALAASDYRSGPKAYYAAPVVTVHFGQGGPKSAATQVPGVKPRLAA